MRYSYKTSGTCSREIQFDVIDGKVYNVEFFGGCNGNLKGIGALVEGADVQDVIDRLASIKCGFRNTSCPDQLAKVLLKLKKEKSERIVRR